jgi:hypothetical protein
MHTRIETSEDREQEEITNEKESGGVTSSV